MSWPRSPRLYTVWTRGIAYEVTAESAVEALRSVCVALGSTLWYEGVIEHAGPGWRYWVSAAHAYQRTYPGAPRHLQHIIAEG